MGGAIMMKDYNDNNNNDQLVFSKLVHSSNKPFTLKCTLDDGRTVTGRFLCLDRLKNLVLSDVLEIRQIPIQNEQQTLASSNNNNNNNNNNKFEIYERQLSQAMIPGEHLVKAEMNKYVFDE